MYKQQAKIYNKVKKSLINKQFLQAKDILQFKVEDAIESMEDPLRSTFSIIFGIMKCSIQAKAKDLNEAIDGLNVI